MATRKPGKRGGTTTATKTPAKEPPAKKTSAKKDAKSFDDKVADLVAGSPSGTAMIVDDDNIADLWSNPRQYLSTGVLAIDAAIGGPRPGIPSARLTEIFGPENIGKTTFLAGLIAQCQRDGGLPITVDSEHKMDLRRMAELGVNLSKMPFEQVTDIEAVFDVLKYWGPKARESLGPDVPILFSWDSVAGTPTAAEFKAKSGQKFQAEAAKVLKQMFRACAQIIAQNQIIFVVTNQVYSKMGGNTFYGPDTETYGGGAIKYHATIRLGLSFRGQLKPPGAAEDDKVPPVGQIVEAKIIKNQIAPPWRWRKYALRYHGGIDNVWSLFEELSPKGIIEQNGSWYRLSDQVQKDLGITVPSWQGGGHFKLNEVINHHPTLYPYLIQKYRELCKDGPLEKYKKKD